MGCSLSSNPHFKMGVTVMGFAEHFGGVLCKRVAGAVLIDERKKKSGGS